MVGADFITGKAVSCDTPSVLQHQGFLGQQTTQVDFCSAITDGGQILIDRCSIQPWATSEQGQWHCARRAGRCRPCDRYRPAADLLLQQ